MIVAIVTVLLLAASSASAKFASGYKFENMCSKYWNHGSGSDGESNWGNNYPGCSTSSGVASKYPSPIDLSSLLKAGSVTDSVTGVDIMKNAKNCEQTVAYLQNWRQSIKISFDDANPCTINIADDSGKVLSSKLKLSTGSDYKLSHMEWRWGTNKETTGSEHVNVKDASSFNLAAELQMYFYDSSQVTSGSGVEALVAATKISNITSSTLIDKAAILIIAIPFRERKIGGKNDFVQKIIAQNGVVRPNNKKAKDGEKFEVGKGFVSTNHKFDISKLFPFDGNSRNFYAYNGMMSYPPCAQAVWFVAQDFNTMSRAQGNNLRAGVRDSSSKKVSTNHKPTTTKKSDQTVYKIYS